MENITNNNDFIFVIIRHVNKTMPNCNEVWQECYKSIRKFYNNKIIIIDNNSDLDVLKYDILLENCETINNKYYETRLFSPFLFLLNYDFNRAIIMHDGCIFQKYVDFSKFQNCKFIWHFDTKIYDNKLLIEEQINVLENKIILLDIFRKQKITGCMGCCLGIDKKFLMELENVYKISNLKNIITDQEKAIAFERTISVLCFSLYPDIINDLSFEGEIINMVWGYIYQHYVNKQKIFKIPSDNGEREIDISNKSIIKIFGARK
jgi:hypothetical protein